MVNSVHDNGYACATSDDNTNCRATTNGYGSTNGNSASCDATLAPAATPPPAPVTWEAVSRCQHFVTP
jgi:hypothetical protein